MWDAYTLDKERDPFGGVRREQEAHRVTGAKLDAALAEIRRLRAGILALHKRRPSMTEACDHCCLPMPCPTVQLLANGQEGRA